MDAEPIATIALFADGVSQIALAAIVESHDVGIRCKGTIVFMLNGDGCAREHETVLLDRASVGEVRVFAITAECAHAYEVGFEDDVIGELRLVCHLKISVAIESTRLSKGIVRSR